MKHLDQTNSRIWEIGAPVRFKESYLATSEDLKKRFSGRVGRVTSYRMGASEPNIAFEKDGRRQAQKLIGVDSGRLETAI